MTPVELAAILAAAVVTASVLSVELGISVALLELGLGMVLGNVFSLNPDMPWLVFVASFAGPFLAAWLLTEFALGWSPKASLIAGTALSTTSLAVVYAVLVETGLNSTRVGKLIMSACFVTDMCTVIALSSIFLQPTVWFPVFVVVSVALVVLLPRLAPWSSPVTAIE